MKHVACTNYDRCECGHQRREHYRQLACKIDSCQCQKFVLVKAIDEQKKEEVPCNRD